MIFLYITMVIAPALVGSVGLYCFFDYKKAQLENEKVCGKQNEEISIKAIQLEIEKENTKQIELNANAFSEKNRAIKAKEDTEQLRIKTNFKDKYNERLY